MSSFVGATPVLRLSVKNPFSGRTYPEKGSAAGVVDTGFDGFLAVPAEAFKLLELDHAATKRTALTADGRPVEMTASPGTVVLQASGAAFDGMVSTWPGVEEMLVGTRLLRRLKVTLDYCSGAFRIEPCD